MTFLHDLITFICQAMQVLGWWTVVALVVALPLAYTIHSINEGSDGQR